MNWFEVIKENRLVTDTVTHTKVNEEKEPEKEDGRCKRKLIEVCEGIHKFFIDLQSQHLVEEYGMHITYGLGNVNLAEKINGLPEEVCCYVLERLKSMNIDSNPPPISYQKLWQSQQNSNQPLIEGKRWDVRSYVAVRPKKLLLTISVNNVEVDDEDYITGIGDTPFEVYFNVLTIPPEVDMVTLEKFARRFNELV